MKPAIDTCPSCKKDNAMAAGGRPGVFKCLYCGFEKLQEARGTAQAGPIGEQPDEALARVTGEAIPKSPAPESRRSTAMEDRRDARHEGHVRALALWTFVWGLIFAGAVFAVYRMTDGELADVTRRIPFRASREGLMAGLGAIAVFHLVVGVGLAAYFGWARHLFTLLMLLGFVGQLVAFIKGFVTTSYAHVDAPRQVGAALSMVWMGACVWAMRGGGSNWIFTKKYRLLHFETRDQVKAQTLRSPFFWLPLLALAATAAVVFRAKLGF